MLGVVSSGESGEERGDGNDGDESVPGDSD